MLAGCSALRLAYSQAPTFVFWWLDAHADFDDAQSQAARRAIDDWFDWHRRTQLPDYAALLARAAGEIRQDTTPERVCRWWQEIRTRTEVALDRAVPAVASIAATLSPQQLRHVEKRFAKSNDKFRGEYLDGDRDDRLRRLVRRTLERAERIYGSLDAAQRETVRRRLAESPLDPQRWLDERIARQRDAMTLLRRIGAGEVPKDEAEAAMRAWIATGFHSPREDYRRYFEQLEQFNCRFTAMLHNDTTPAQRQHAVERLRGWETDLRALADEPR